MLLLGIYVLYRNPQSKINLSFFLFTVLIALFDFARYNFTIARTYQIAFDWSLFFFTYHWSDVGHWLFILAITESWEKVRSRTSIWLMYIPAILFSFLYFLTGYLYPNISATALGWSYAQGKGLLPLVTEYAMTIWTVVIYGTMFGYAASFYKRTFDPIKKIQVKYLAGALFCAGIFEGFNALLLIFDLTSPFAIISGMIVYAAIIAVAILKFDFFAINASTAADSIISTMTDAVFVLSNDYRIRLVNGAALRMLGQIREVTLNRTIDSIIKLGPKQRLSWQLKKSLQKNEEVADIEGLLLHDQGEDPMPISLSASHINSSRGAKRGVVCIVRDISERKLQEDRLKSSYSSLKLADRQIRAEIAKLRAILVSVGEGLIVTDQLGYIAMVNRRVLQLLGWREEQVLGKSTAEQFVLLTGKGEVSQIQSALTQGILVGRVVRISLSDAVFVRGRNGNLIPISLILTPVMLGDEVIGGIIIFENISKEAEVDKAKTEFVSLAAHQLLMPLTAIMWNLESAKPDTKMKVRPGKVDSVTTAYGLARAMSDLVKQFLNVSRIELGKLSVEPEPIELQEVIRAVVDEQQIAAKKKGVQVSVTVNGMFPRLMLDKVLIRIVVQNLLSNAIKYTPAKGKVAVALRKAKQSAVLTVSDTGVGIPNTQQAQVFTKLFRAENVLTNGSEGNGLGLYLVKSIVTLMKGDIRFSSRENKGTTFTVTIPLKGMKRQVGSRGLVEVH